MKFKLIDILILVIPVVIMLLITPILPDKVPIHWSISGGANRFIDKKFSFILGAIPFAVYELYKFKHSRK